jgi:hypothetical protein
LSRRIHFSRLQPDESRPIALRCNLTGLIISIMGPAPLTPEKECYSVLFLQMFPKADIKERSVSDTLGTRNAGQPLEELVQIQALSVDLREAVMACLCGRESRRWTVLELVERLKNLGVCASRA